MLSYRNICSITEGYSLPIGLRQWFIRRTNEQIEREEAAMNGNKGGNSQDNGGGAAAIQALEKMAGKNAT